MTEDKEEVVIQRKYNTGGCTGKGFVKGDKRINRGGRPKFFDALRKLAQKIAGELPDEADVTRVTEMLIEMSKSKNPSDRALFLAYAFGKPKEEVDVTSKGESINQKEDNAERFDRTISTLADAIREIVSEKSEKQDSSLDTSE